MARRSLCKRTAEPPNIYPIDLLKVSIPKRTKIDEKDDNPGRDVAVQQVRFMAELSTAAPGTFDVACFVPHSAVTEMDPQGLPGALVADVMLSMGIGELRVMTRVNSIGIAVTDQPPSDSLNAWDLVEIIDSAPAH